jgi:methylmalonyl-CoA/ethylmalonyl-CoA epimerase
MDVSVFPDLAVHHFSISVPDIERSAAWYGHIFGFSIEARFSIEKIGAKGAFLVRDPLRIELWQLAGNDVPDARKQPHSDLQTGGMKHIAFRVANLGDRLAQLAGLGVDIAAVQYSAAQPMVAFTGVGEGTASRIFAAFIRDPDGILVELLDDQALKTLQQA